MSKNKETYESVVQQRDELQKKLLAYEQAAKKPIGSFHISVGQVEATTDYCSDGEWPVRDGEVLVYAAPVLPKQPELLSIGELLQRLEEQTSEKWVRESEQPVSEPYKLPDGWVMVPQKIFLDASDIESICSQCGDGHKSGYGDFTDGLLWIGDIQCDNGTIMHGLHISSSDYQEEGGLTLAEFKASAQESE